MSRSLRVNIVSPLLKSFATGSDRQRSGVHECQLSSMTATDESGNCTVCVAKVSNLGGYCCANLRACPNKLIAKPPTEVGKSVYTTVARRPDAHLRLMIAQSDRPLPSAVVKELQQAPEPWVREAIAARGQKVRPSTSAAKKSSARR